MPQQCHEYAEATFDAGAVSTDDRASAPVDRSGIRVRRTRRNRLALCLGAVLVLVLTFGGGCRLSGQELLIGAGANSERHVRGLGALQVDDELTAKAQAWAQHMAATQTLGHSRLTDGVSSGSWRVLGENVGRGDSLQLVHDAFMASPSHRATILDRRYSAFGIGVATSADGRYYVAVVFKG